MLSFRFSQNKHYSKKNLKHSLRLKNLTTFHTIKHNLKYRLYTSMVRIASLYRSNKIRYTIFLKLKQNNLFCTFKNIITNKLLLVASAGKLQLNVSKNKLYFKIFLKIKLLLKNKNLVSLLNLYLL